MTVLALDTTRAAGSIALVADGGIRHELIGDASLTHGQRLPADLMRLLGDAGALLGDVDLFAVAAGPGSFTGLRVGIATMQGLAMATGKRIVPVSALEALARTAGSVSGPIAVWMDAQRGEVFAALYDCDARTVLVEPSSLSPEATLDAWRAALAGRVTFAGDGAIRYADTIRASGPRDAAIPGSVPPLAGIIGSIAAAHPERAVAPHAVIPIYVRRPDAELARQRNAAGR